MSDVIFMGNIPYTHSCTKEANSNIEIENAYLTGKQSVVPDLISEAVCTDCGKLVAHLYSSNEWRIL